MLFDLLQDRSLVPAGMLHDLARPGKRKLLEHRILDDAGPPGREKVRAGAPGPQGSLLARGGNQGVVEAHWRAEDLELGWSRHSLKP